MAKNSTKFPFYSLIQSVHISTVQANKQNSELLQSCMQNNLQTFLDPVQFIEWANCNLRLCVE